LEFFVVIKNFRAVAFLIFLAAGCNQQSNGVPQGRPWRVPSGGQHAQQWSRAQESFNRGDMDSAAKALEEIVNAEPKNRQALFLLAEVLQRQGFNLAHGAEKKKGYELFRQSAQHMKVLRATYPQLNVEENTLLPTALYNEACAEALDGHADKALAALEDAIKSGFSEMELMSKDPDLESLRELPRFQALFDRARVF
jgi:tetratricopeptide (TPR) repeat protein